MTNTNPVPDERAGRPPRVAVQALIYSETLSPEEISARLDLQPTTTAQKGVKYGKRTGTRVDVPRHMWQLSSESLVSSEDMTEHLEWVLSKLLSVRERLRVLHENREAQSVLVGIIWTNGTSAHMRISPRHAELLAALQVELKLEFADYGDDS